ncbi:hypothetical protein Calag_0184 [Caldisphaera lagunensis DSM 15908]|uniref:DUF3782 domain-containing protein n=1 Tax=Caldisphaera lagunensis (strain DSM 15908 / JCM 11604 / ANMR 0165 / IC-154) TaxID=1056495 RepID=L0A7W8_CALLD|nr:DUF3782 domain-containing protein [Caldisphaera lagunensis]AFZ69968.1 hypothetical protein Calag_0184 [Caldisphaera lagunensis DSM 15908]
MANESKIDLKKEIIRLLKEDENFRYEVVGLIGIEEMIKRLEKNTEEIVSLRAETNKLRQDVNLLIEEMNKLREETNSLRAETNKLRQDVNLLIEEMNKLREETNSLRAETNKLRQEMMRGFESMDIRLTALGARWGVYTEDTVKNLLKGVLEKELNYKIEKWVYNDSQGVVYGYPSIIEIDMAIIGDKILLIEFSSHIKRSDPFTFKKKAELFEKTTGKKASRLIIATPYIDQDAENACQILGIEVYSKF